MLQQEEEESAQSQGAKQFSTNTDTKNIYWELQLHISGSAENRCSSPSLLDLNC